MTTLEAINQILAAIGEPPVTATDTGGTTEQAEAETFLDRSRREVLKQGWHCNTDYAYASDLPNRRLTVTAAATGFSWDETITESVTGATGKFRYAQTVGSTFYVYLIWVSGTFDGASRTLTGGTSGYTRTDSATATVTTAKQSYDATNHLNVIASYRFPDFSMRGGFLYDTTNLTFDWTEDITLDIIRLLDFTDLYDSLAEYVVAHASFEFQRYKKRAQQDDGERGQELLARKAAARNDDTRFSRTNLFATREARQMRGRDDHYLLRGGL